MSPLSRVLKYLKYRLRARTAHGVHSPFVFRFIHELIENDGVNYYELGELHKVRQQLLSDERKITITDFGAGSKIFKGNERRISDIARHGISSRKFSELYFKLINFCNAKTVVELGTSIGLNTLYLARAGSEVNVYSIEGSEALSEFAAELLKQHKAANVTLLTGTFEAKLPGLLNKIEAIDLLFVDGNHRYAPTMDYFKMALAKKHNDSVFIFDDIHWSEEMENAWDEIRRHSDVTLSIDLFYAGLIFFRKEQRQKEHFVLKY